MNNLQRGTKRKEWNERKKEEVISMKVLFLVLSLLGCSIGMATEGYNYEFEWQHGRFYFKDGIYGYFNYYNSFWEESETGICNFNTADTDSVTITIKKSSVQGRVGLSFTCDYWPVDPRNRYIKGFSNAKILTNGTAASDTIICTFDYATSVKNSNTTWSSVKQLFQTK